MSFSKFIDSNPNSLPIRAPEASIHIKPPSSSISAGAQRRMTLKQQQLEELERRRQALLSQDEEDIDEYVDRIKTVYSTIKKFMNSIKNNKYLIEGHDYAGEILKGESQDTIEESFSIKENFINYLKHSITSTNLFLRVPFVPVNMMPLDKANEFKDKIIQFCTTRSYPNPSNPDPEKYSQMNSFLHNLKFEKGFYPGSGFNVSRFQFVNPKNRFYKSSSTPQSVQSFSHASVWRSNKAVANQSGHQPSFTIEWDGRTVFLSPIFENSVIDWIVKNSSTNEFGFSNFNGITFISDSSGVCIPSHNNREQIKPVQMKSVYLNYLMDEHETMRPHREFRQRPEHKYTMCVKMIQLLEEMTENYWILGKRDIQSLEFIEGKLSELT
jgi:hypothetical protein